MTKESTYRDCNKNAEGHGPKMTEMNDVDARRQS